MKKWIALVLVLLLALGGYVAAGPYLAIHGIRTALAEHDTARLQKHVDFPALRVNLRAQLQDHLVREAGADMQSSLFGSVALSVAGSVLGAGVDTLVTPLGIGALLQGRSMWKKALGETIGGDTHAPATPADPLKHAQHRYESLSRFTATAPDQDGDLVVFVFTRQGLRWRLTDIRLPL
ncbi:DUF2939 domain-containing protein [Pseudoxanthomonas wuyuanensis]|uniref:DUF2939 domain-containing protein n=1 Tax=Pseudoxanthomonas wuyuanensis TaxID=1073196 RepID=A0A286CXV0_9GAMM|nr:DUF2939 domain-containing protein [Pseudoxanthomonas wuyuanensis]KAF1722639.1 DUF2939 domain-containing protein [Pseudoxanthomonas wuyuanensis]SOD51222.1 Protein of unknown function [Pseudoxanthomonas wuyuanensis]